METTDSGEPKALVLGDGDLSFSAALNAEGLRLTATTLESREDLVRRYANAGAHIAALEGAGARVLHGVDATRLRETLPGDVGSLFHRIIFNFPYQAFGGIKGLRRLLAAFLEEAAALLAPDGVIEVALCAGQGGTAKDRQARGWANSWRAPLVAARQGLALAGVDDWHPPAREGFRYAPLREPGNKDAAGGAGGKGFPTDGALVHRFVRCRRAVCGSSGEVGQYSERLVVAQAAMLAVSPFPEASWHEEDDEDRGTRYGPRHPRFRPGQRARLCCPHGLGPGALCTAARALAKSPLETREVTQGKKSLEVLVERPPFTPCFQASFTKADWLQLCWYDSASDAPHTVHFDLEVLAMIQLGLRDRRLLRCHEPTPVYQCLFYHDLRLTAPVALDAAKLVELICQVCGEEILLEAFELTPEESGAPETECHWRLFFASVASALDDEIAYGAYQAVRRAVAECGETLC